MIIPIRCKTCNKVLAGKWKAYQNMVAESEGKENILTTDLKILKQPDSKQKQALDKLGLKRYCCRVHFLTQADLL